MRSDNPLSRTTRLINQEFFNASANEDAIAAGLAATTIRLIADDANMSSRSGQAALVTSWQLIARTGIKIDLLAPKPISSLMCRRFAAQRLRPRSWTWAMI